MRVLVASGSSGGHIFPALTFLNLLKSKDKEVSSLLVLPRKNIGSAAALFADYKIAYISITPFRLRLSPESLLGLFRFLKGALESLGIILSFKPDIVVGFGSIASVPLVLFGWFLRIPTVIHEQNVMPGRANRFLAGFCTKIAISFEKSKEYFSAYAPKVVLSGNPARPDLVRLDRSKALSFLGFKQDKFTLLVMGGSLASHRINLAVSEALGKSSVKNKLQVVHLCGEKDLPLLNSRYQNLGIDFKLLNFLKEIHYAYSASDLVICRAGATTLQELISFALPAILVPYPFAYKHQLANGSVLKEQGCARIIEDETGLADRLQTALEELVEKKEILMQMRSAYQPLVRPKAQENFITAIIGQR